MEAAETIAGKMNLFLSRWANRNKRQRISQAKYYKKKGTTAEEWIRQYRQSPEGRKRVLESQRKHYRANRDQVIADVKQYYQVNKRKIIRRILERQRTDPTQKLISALRIKTNKVLKGHLKSGPTLSLIGCSADKLRKYVERKMLPGMSWENYGCKPGQWCLDHIRPVISFDLSDAAQQRKAFNYKNLQCMWSLDNSSKGSMYNGIRWRAKYHQIKIWKRGT